MEKQIKCINTALEEFPKELGLVQDLVGLASFSDADMTRFTLVTSEFRCMFDAWKTGLRFEWQQTVDELIAKYDLDPDQIALRILKHRENIVLKEKLSFEEASQHVGEMQAYVHRDEYDDEGDLLDQRGFGRIRAVFEDLTSDEEDEVWDENAVTLMYTFPEDHPNELVYGPWNHPTFESFTEWDMIDFDREFHNEELAALLSLPMDEQVRMYDVLDDHMERYGTAEDVVERAQNVFWIADRHFEWCKCSWCVEDFVRQWGMDDGSWTITALHNTPETSEDDESSESDSEDDDDHWSHAFNRYRDSQNDDDENNGGGFPMLFHVDEVEMQGDVGGEPDLEDASTVDKAGNVSFADEREVKSDEAQLSGPVSTKDQHGDIADSEWRVRDILTRECRIASFDWDSQFNGMKMYLPADLDRSACNMIFSQLKFFSFSRFGIKIRVQVNGTPFHCGRLLVVLVPPRCNTASPLNTFAAMTMPHSFLDASVSNSVILETPFTHILSQFPLRADSLINESIVQLGTLEIYKLNQLRAATGSSQKLGVTIFASLINPEVHHPTYPIEKFSFARTPINGLLSHTDAYEESEMQGLTGVEGFVKSGAETLGNLAGGVVSGGVMAAGRLLGLVQDKPLRPLPADPIVNRSQTPLCHGAGLDISTRLALTNVSKTDSGPGILGTTMPDFQLSKLVGLHTLLQRDSWSTSQGIGTEIAEIPVTPSYITQYTEAEDYQTMYAPTMLAYCSRPFTYWRGDLIYKIQNISTHYHSGRLAIVFNASNVNPNLLPNPQKFDCELNHNVLVVDIQEKQEIEFVVPFMASRPWLRCDRFRGPPNIGTDSDYAEYLNQAATGIVRIYVLNPLVAPSNVSTTIDINIFVKAGENFQVAVPAPLTNLTLNSQIAKMGNVSLSALYPFSEFVRIETSPNFRETVDELYYQGLRLVRTGQLSFIDHDLRPKKWWNWGPPAITEKTVVTQGLLEEGYIWKLKIYKLRQLAITDPTRYDSMCKYIQSFPDYPHPNPIEEAEMQGKDGVQKFVSTRKDEMAPVSLIKGYESKDPTAMTLSENAMALETVMKRYYPIVFSPPIYHTGDIASMCIPVSPTFSQPFPYIMPAGAANKNMTTHMIQWFSALYTYWRGSLRYRIVYSGASSVVALHNPRDVFDYKVRRCVDRHEVQNQMHFAADLAVATTQSTVDVEVGFFSPYNQLFVDTNGTYLDNEFCNGTLQLYFFRDPVMVANNIPLSVQIYLSVGEDFVLNLIQDPKRCFTENFAAMPMDIDQWWAKHQEFCYASNDSSRATEMLGHSGFRWLDLKSTSGFGSGPDPLNVTGFCALTGGAEGGIDEKAEMQGLFDTPTNTMKQIGEAMTGVRDLTSKVTEMLHQGQLDTQLLSSNLRNTLQNTMTTVNETASSVNKVADRVDAIVDSIPKLGDPEQWTYQKYIDLSINVTLLWVTGKNFITVIQDPNIQSLVNAGMSFCTLLGYQYRDTLANCLNIVAGWAIKYNPLAQAQALDGPFADLVESAESKIVPILAVFGTVIYAFLFDVVPKFWEIKKLIKSFFEDEEPTTMQKKQNAKAKLEAQGLTDHLKNAHFATLGFKAIQTVYMKMLEYATMFLDWLLDRENPQVKLAQAAEFDRDEILSLTAELDELDNEMYVTDSLTDVDVHNRFYHMRDRVDALMKKALTKEDGKYIMDQRVSAVILQLRQRVIKLLKRVEDEYIAENWRYDPFCVCLCGQPGTGKTALMVHVAYAIQDALDLPRYNLVYNKTVTKDGFWNGYKNQTLCCWDEFGQNVEADQSVAEFINLRGNAPCKISMAALEDKKRWFTSKGIILTTNVPFETFSNTLRCGEAVLRRRHKVIRVTFKPGHSAQDFENVAADNTFDMLEFAVLDRLTGEVIGNGLDYVEMLNIVSNHAREWDRKQTALQELFKEMGVDRVMPRGVVFQTFVPEGGVENEQQQLDLDDIMAELDGDDEVDYQSALETDFDDDGEMQGLIRRKSMNQPGYSDIVLPSTSTAFVINPAYKFTSEAERIEAEMFVIEAETFSEKYKRTLREAKSKVVESKYYLYIKNLFQTISQQVVDWFKNNPKIMALSGALLALGTMGALYFGTQQEIQAGYETGPAKQGHRQVVAEGGSYDTGPQKTARRTVVAEGTYEAGPSKMPRKLVEAQGCDDPSGMDVKNVVHPYVTKISWDRSVDHWRQMHAMEIGGSIILAPAHFFAGAIDGEKFMLLSHNPPLEVMYDASRLVRKEDKDWVLYDIGARKEPRKKMIKYFVKEEHLGRIHKTMSVLLRTQDEHLETLYGEARAIRAFKYTDQKFGDVYTQTGWTTEMPTAKGDCGAPLLVLTPNIPPPHRICGIHVAGKPAESRGYVVLIVQEHVQEMWDLLESRRSQVIGMPIDPSINVMQGLTCARMIPEGDYSLYGTMPDRLAPIQPSKSSLIKTPFHERMKVDFECAKQPARLMKAIGSDESPLAKALTKYGHKSEPIDPRFLKVLEPFMVQEFEGFMNHQGRRIFTEQEAINGIPGIDGLDRINMKSSPGWPYQVLKKQEGGKYYLFDADGNVKDEELRKRLDRRLKHARRGERVPSVWRDCLKDELRPNSKVEANSTRLFTIAPVDFTILVRQYFMDFIAAMNKSFHDTWVAVGMDPESLDWTEMYNYLHEYGDNAMATDYKGFDGKCHAELIELFGHCVNQWYRKSAREYNEEVYYAECVRNTLINEMIHTMQLVSNVVYASHKGNPSGNPITTALNTFINRCYQLYGWWKITKRPLADFNKHVRSKYYGDDVISTVLNCPEYNQLSLRDTLRDIGIELTMDVKDQEFDTPYRRLEECTFLKRGFRRDSAFGKMWILPVMSKETIEAFYFWYRRGENMVDQLYENCRVALWFASFHGEAYYNKILRGWERAFQELPQYVKPFTTHFIEWVDLFQFKSGMYEKGRMQADLEEMEKEMSAMDIFMKGSSSKAIRVAMGLVQAPIYYACAILGVMANCTKEREITDSRWAVAIPSGEGKSYLAKQYPHLFVDHDELLIAKFGLDSITKGLPWSSDRAKNSDFPIEDRRILLVHHPNNTRRQLIGSFITHFPTFVRINCFQRLQYPSKKVVRMSREERNNYLVDLVQRLEPELTANTLP